MYRCRFEGVQSVTPSGSRERVRLSTIPLVSSSYVKASIHLQHPHGTVCVCGVHNMVCGVVLSFVPHCLHGHCSDGQLECSDVHPPFHQGPKQTLSSSPLTAPAPLVPTQTTGLPSLTTSGGRSTLASSASPTTPVWH